MRRSFVCTFAVDLVKLDEAAEWSAEVSQRVERFAAVCRRARCVVLTLCAFSFCACSGVSVSGGGASTTGLSTQVLTVLTWRGVQRLLKHSRSELAGHVRAWVQQQYQAIIANKNLLKEHKARADRMDRLKELTVAQQKLEETKVSAALCV